MSHRNNLPMTWALANSPAPTPRGAWGLSHIAVTISLYCRIAFGWKCGTGADPGDAGRLRKN